jgi:hypothetical protein
MKTFPIFVVASMLLSPVFALAVTTTTSPGKNAVSITASGTLDGVGDITPITAQILKGKAKSVIEMQASISVEGNPSLSSIYLAPSINGTPMTPVGQSSQCNSGSSSECAFTDTFWMDIDAAEAITPGSFVGQPLTIHMTAGNSSIGGSGLDYTATFTARMGKK